MAASFLPTIFVPIIGFVFPAVVLSFFFNFIQKENIN
uniref:Photosystem I reaction center subunit VIII n=1 Tax=Lepocinclis steinii TaxID=459226 RepID=A0A3G3LLS0_9EUGL|nr:photosystem I 4 kDa hydrophobic subunit [Lepocinclis steinii]AYQ93648.1 photosystem I 4 kDa hydrophobic subunit [Lepocinclis steinii]